MRSTTTAAANGRPRVHVHEEKESTIRGTETVWTAAMTAPVSSRSIPANSRHDGAVHRLGRSGAEHGCNPAYRCLPPPRRGRQNVTPVAAQQELMRRLRRTKIVATLGPSSSERSVIAALFRAGADVFRINISPPRMTACGSWCRRSVPSKSNSDGRSASWSTCKARSCGSASSRPAVLEEGPELRLRSDAKAGNAGVHLPHREIFEGVGPGTRSCSTTASSSSA